MLGLWSSACVLLFELPGIAIGFQDQGEPPAQEIHRFQSQREGTPQLDAAAQPSGRYACSLRLLGGDFVPWGLAGQGKESIITSVIVCHNVCLRLIDTDPDCQDGIA